MQELEPTGSRYTTKALTETLWLYDVTCIGLILAFMAIALLWNYQGLPLQYWDESRNANNALEMALSANWLVPSYGGSPDHWNTKPPLLIWLMAGLLKLDLPPLLAVRLPAAAAASATVIMVWAAIRYGLGDRLAALIAAMLLISAKGYTGIHGAHTGDYDSLLAFFTTAYLLCLWQVLIRPKHTQTLWLLAAGSGLVGAVMTKGPAGLFGLIGLGLYLIASRQLWRVITDWRWWLVVLGAGSICIAYYLTRERYDAGYLQAVWANELGGRYGETNEAHYHSPWFYLHAIFKDFQPGCLLLLLSFSLLGANNARRQLMHVTLITGAGILLLLSCAKTQLYWYLMPVYPLLAIAAAIAIVDALHRFKWRARVKLALLIVFIALPALISLYRNAIGLPQKAQQQNTTSQYGQLLQTLTHKKLLPKEFTLVDDGIENSAGLIDYNPELQFYAELQRTKGYVIHVATLHKATATEGFIASCDHKNTAPLRRLITTPLIDNAICVAGYRN
jgi:4-amino-4-deoxy-L-arabinose transferase-like glycosyltransferase